MNNTLNLSTDAFTINPRYRLQWEEAQQCHVLLYPEGLVKLSDSAVEILNRCKQATTAANLIATLQQAYPDATTLADDVNEFLDHAREQEWILRSEVKQ
ncbi:MAG: pyrroloquinoline quinone biosynthesis peptide chaperone PqqD [Pseudomonadota bacterium]